MNGFNPIFDPESNILILGSFPSIISRKTNFYYANPHNRFWEMLSCFYNKTFDNIQSKIDFLIENKIALWDIVKSCDIKSSMDSDIKNAHFVNLKKVLFPHTKVNLILCNGKKSYELTKKYLKLNNIQIPCICMPSTSPANFKFDIDLWYNYLIKEREK